MTSYANDETAQKLAAAMQREALAARAEMDLLVQPSTRTPSHIVGIAMTATRANIRLFVLGAALAEHTGIAKTKDVALADLIEEIPELTDLLRVLDA